MADGPRGRKLRDSLLPLAWILLSSLSGISPKTWHTAGVFQCLSEGSLNMVSILIVLLLGAEQLLEASPQSREPRHIPVTDSGG